jgi:CRP/FNR family transcriptional regulator, cyclic AMP receptor protein
VDRGQKLQFLSKVKLFKGTTDEQLAKIEYLLNEKKVQRGEVIIEENTPGHEMFILVDGKVAVSHSLTLKVSKNSFEEKDKALNFLDAKNFSCFGEIALIEPTSTRTATVTAQTECTLFVIERRDFENLCENDYQLGYLLVRNIAEEICSRLKKYNDDLLKLTTALSIALSR